MQRQREHGFSLIEILVVVVIVGIVASVALLSVGLVGDDRELQTEARRFSALVRVASDEAMMQGREFGLEVMQDGYRFVEYDPFSRQWAELFGDDIFRPRQLPERMELELYIEGQRVALDAEPARLQGQDDDRLRRSGPAESYEPHIYLFSSGDVSPFELRVLQSPGREQVLIRQPSVGTIEIVEEDEI